MKTKWECKECYSVNCEHEIECAEGDVRHTLAPQHLCFMSDGTPAPKWEKVVNPTPDTGIQNGLRSDIETLNFRLKGLEKEFKNHHPFPLEKMDCIKVLEESVERLEKKLESHQHSTIKGAHSMEIPIDHKKSIIITATERLNNDK